MERHHLTVRSEPSALVEVAGEICGLHAQLMSSAELSLWARIDGLEQGQLEAALWQDRALVKLWAMRGTLHLLPAAKLGLWLSALGTQTKYGSTGHPEIAALSEAVATILHGRILTRAELAVEVERMTGSAELAEYVRQLGLVPQGGFLPGADLLRAGHSGARALHLPRYLGPGEPWQTRPDGRLPGDHPTHPPGLRPDHLPGPRPPVGRLRSRDGEADGGAARRGGALRPNRGTGRLGTAR